MNRSSSSWERSSKNDVQSWRGWRTFSFHCSELTTLVLPQYVSIVNSVMIFPLLQCRPIGLCFSVLSVLACLSLGFYCVNAVGSTHFPRFQHSNAFYLLYLVISSLITHHSSFVISSPVYYTSSLVARRASFFISSFVYPTSSLVTSSLHSSLVTRQWRATPPQKAIKERQRSQLGIYLVLWTPPRSTRWAIH